ncbi:MAG: glycosyltransferase [Pirellula sp.]|jgi:glycosyltransferase involved in cell wall biosynthesis|nr:glycosyltransferase [Pirellula sp.]
MRKRVCWIIPSLDRGGAEKQLVMLANRLDPSEFDATLIVLSRTGPLESELDTQRTRLILIGKERRLDPRVWWRLAQTLKTLRPDLVHTWIFAANAYGRTAAKWAGVKCILASERSVDPWKSTWQLVLDRALARFTKGITTNSPGVVDFYADRGIDRRLFEIIPNGIEPRDPKKEIARAEAFQRLGIDPKRRLILSIGRLWPQKGYKDLIWAAEMLRVLRGNTSYAILGEGPERERLEEYRDNVRATSEVYLVGHRDDAISILPHADLLWNGSLYEGQSNTILEAMQAGVPVMASDIPGNRDLVRDGETGILFPVGDVDRLMRVSNQLLNDEPMRKRLIDAARDQILKEHDVQTMVDRHADYYRRMLKS